MATHFNYSLQNFSMNNAKVLTGNSQPVPDFKGFAYNHCGNCLFNAYTLPTNINSVGTSMTTYSDHRSL